MARKITLLANLGIILFLTLACAGSQTAILTQPIATGQPSTLVCEIPDPAPVPAEFLETYQYLSVRLEGRLADRPELFGRLSGRGRYGAELLPANGNRGNALLEPATMTGVRLYLDRLKAIGLDGVSIQISDPLLTAEPFDHEAFVDFFRLVVDEVHARGMRVMAEAGPVFPNPEFSEVRIDWSDISLEEYFSSRRRQLVRIAQDIRPDLLSLGNEPETEQLLTGLSFTPIQYEEFVRDTLAEIGSERNGVLIGAGAGTWEDPAYINLLLPMEGLDFINLHVYPLDGPAVDLFDWTLEAARETRNAGKKVVIGETWLYKTTPAELSYGQGYQEVIGRDVFSFWWPLDSDYLRLMIHVAEAEQFEFVNFYWSGYFFQYLDYENLPAGSGAVETFRRLNQAQAANIKSGILSPLGCAYQELLAGSTH